MDKQLTYLEAVEELRRAYEREQIQLTSQISTLQLSVNQQTIRIKYLEKELAAKEQDCYA